ncbi:hypothetical protein SAMN05444920_1011042 [Nonomuraea solani]|uniref:Secreted protein n=1 Tax=Nonomuraea solani TaxID=1144553 RepID=A0A1H5W015_9ACTN|nr:hypothetical protein [Nonomuraea solani]SEF92810.1 hypothetical protein SAMN05444920_1011042 [Nonomuraea solani]
MSSHILRHRTAIVLTLLAAVVLPAAPAQATTARVPVFLEVRGDNNQKLSGMYGWIEFNDSTTYTYQFYLCRESSYSAAGGYVWMNDRTSQRASYSVNYGNTSIAECRYPADLFGKTDYVGSTVTNVRLEVEGVNFNGQGQATWRRSGTTYDNPFN